MMITSGRITSSVTKAIRYKRHLKNGISVWFNAALRNPLPPFRFRNGMVWHHGPLDQPELLFQEIFLDCFYEPLDAPGNAVVMDIGANIGAVTLYWAWGRPDILFHLYEPNPDCLPALEKNLQRNGLLTQVKAHRDAVSGSNSYLELWIGVPTALATSYGQPPQKGARKVTVRSITLDEAWERTGRAPIWMLKIDTEGAEGDILDAASDEMLRSVQNACIEWHNNIVPGVRERCLKRLEREGFSWREKIHPWDEGIIFAKRRQT